MTRRRHPRLAVIVPVGPDPRDPQRLPDLIDSLCAYEAPALRDLILIDDAPEPRPLADAAGAAGCDVHVIRTSLEESAGAERAMLGGTLAGLHRAGRLDAELVAKLDTDALVVAPFSQRLAAEFRADRRLGVVGSYDRTWDGHPRDWSFHRGRILAAALPAPARLVGVDGRLGVEPADPRRAARRVRQLGRALARGYDLGEHCLGGAYAVGGGFAAWLGRDRHLRQAAGWLEAELPEDVVLGLIARSAGFHLRGMVGPGEPFALRQAGLPAAPEELLRDGAGIIHSVRNDERVAEDAIRRLCAEHRSANGETPYATA